MRVQNDNFANISPVLGSGVLVADFWNEHHRVILSGVSAGTARGYWSAWRNRVEPSFGANYLHEITAFDIEGAFEGWSGSVSTRKDALYTLSAIFRSARKHRLVEVNPCSEVELRRVQEDDPSERALSDAEIERLFEVLPAEGVYRRFVLALFFTGCRLGEVAALRVSDVDLSIPGKETLSVSETASAGFKGELVFGNTKGRSKRFVSVSEPFLPVVLEAMAGKGEHDLLFPGPRGGVINSQNLNRALKWNQLRQRVKSFPEGEMPLRFHDLRHTMAVLLGRSGLAISDVMAILGHSSMQVTQKYMNTRKDAATRGNEALNRLFDSFPTITNRGGE